MVEKQAGDFQLYPVKSGEVEGVAVFKQLTQGHNIKSLGEKAKEFVEKQKNSVLIIVNQEGKKANVVVASNSVIDASKVVSSLSSKLGGGGSGTSLIAIGGGKSEKAGEILDEFEVIIEKEEK